MKMKKIDAKELDEEYKRLIIGRLCRFSSKFADIKLLDKEIVELETLYENELSKRVRRAFDPEPCIYCGFSYKKKSIFSKCPRCKK